MEKRLNKQAVAYEWLKARILDGTFGPGYRIVIDRVAREMGVSPIPVREAIRRLEAEGFVEVERFTGAKVTRIDGSTYVQTLAVLAVLEGYATAQAYRHLTTEDYARLRDTNAAMERAREDFDLTAYSRLNERFHAIILARCPNPYLAGQVQAVQQRMDAVRVSVFNLIPHRAGDSIAEHTELIRLMEEDAGEDVVEQFARRHKLATLEAFRRWQAVHDGSRIDREATVDALGSLSARGTDS
ncbi:MAG: GntR family transcriptional regulator [Thermoflavifilum sp.]|nr:GntR family transcriptional regulator [Thermoflavifilum sp.]MCL6514267.1 GntR family transcriptional regulator [Alicyclobacillus sp.]